MRFAGTLAILVSLSGAALGAVDNPPSAPASANPQAQPPSNAAPKVSPEVEAKIAEFCGRAHLSITAMSDCTTQMAAARTDEDRVRVEHTFAMGNVEVVEPH